MGSLQPPSTPEQRDGEQSNRHHDVSPRRRHGTGTTVVENRPLKVHAIASAVRGE